MNVNEVLVSQFYNYRLMDVSLIPIRAVEERVF